MILPTALAPWHPVLQELHPVVVQALGPLLPRLAAALGPLPAPAQTYEGDPDGFDGLSQRGPWERLLASAWALADEVPDEFLRRAADGELAFLRQARSTPAGGWRGVVWLDVGPEGVGGPRLVALAVALVLARRIRDAGGTPVAAWSGPAAVDSAPLDDIEALRAWLSVRTRAQPGAADLRALADTLELTAVDRVWAVGGPTLAALARPAGHEALVVREPLTDDDLHVALDAHERQTLRLPRPPDAALVQLLRDPRAPPPSPAVEALRHLALVWTEDGAHLFVIDRERVRWVSLAPDPTEPPTFRDLQLGAPVAAAGWHRDGPAFLLQHGPVLGFAFPEGARGAWNGAPTSLPVGPELVVDRPAPLWVLPDPRGAALHDLPGGATAQAGVPRAACLLADDRGTLWLLDALNGGATAVLRDLSPTLPSSDPSAIVRWRQRDRDGVLHSVEWVRRANEGPGPTDLRAFVGPRYAAGPLPTLLDQGWRLDEDPEAPSPQRFEGELLAVAPTTDGTRLGLQGRRLVRVSEWAVETLLTLPAPLVHHAVPPTGGWLAGIDSLGQIVLVDLVQMVVRHRLPITGGPA